MTFPRAVNNKYAGTHYDGNAVSFIIFYNTATNAANSRRLQSGIRQAGWCWFRPIPNKNNAPHGPFTSSRAAYRDATKQTRMP